MSLIDFPNDFPGLKGKTIVITGGSSGIGEGYVRLARKHGANVVFGDLNSDLGDKLAKETGATFVQTDVTVYSEQLRLFREALEKHGKIDHAIANAGLYEPKEWFDPRLDLESVEKVGWGSS
jgi:NAD(P)-dependent dehydrogenase (short-subunit alcohol dehydrogenase family)